VAALYQEAQAEIASLKAEVSTLQKANRELKRKAEDVELRTQTAIKQALTVLTKR
jgi:hypothetical protein